MFLLTHNAKELRARIQKDEDKAFNAFCNKYKFKESAFPIVKTYLWKSKDGYEYLCEGICMSRADQKRGQVHFSTMPLVRHYKGLFAFIPCSMASEFILITPHVFARYAERIGIEGEPIDIVKRFFKNNRNHMASIRTEYNGKSQYEFRTDEGV